MPYADREKKRQYDHDYIKRRKRRTDRAYVDATRRANVRRRAKMRAFLRAYKEEKGCADCGTKDFRVLDFDHRDRSEKSFNLAIAAAGQVSQAAMRAEVAKCDVRCANCHRIKTFEETRA